MDPNAKYPYLSIYEAARTTRTDKERAVSNLDDFLRRITVAPSGSDIKDYPSKFLTRLFIEIADFKLLRKNDKNNSARQDSALSNIYSLLKSADNKSPGLNFNRRWYDDPEKLMECVCSIMKNDSSIWVAKIPQSLKFIVDKYASFLDREDITLEESQVLDFLLGERDDLTEKNKRRLKGVTDLAVNARNKELSEMKESANKIGNKFLQWKKNDLRTGGTIQRPGSEDPNNRILIRARVYEHLKTVSQHYGFVPTAYTANEVEPIRKKIQSLETKPPSNQLDHLLYQSEIDKLKEKERILLDIRNKQQGDFRKNQHKKNPTQEDLILDFEYSVSNKVGSCNELSWALFLLLKCDPHLLSINNKVKLMHLQRPHDHIFVGVKNLTRLSEYDGHDPGNISEAEEKNTLIIDAWLKHIDLEKNVSTSSEKNTQAKKNLANNFRSEAVKANQRERGFFGSQDRYINFLNNHVDGKYVKAGEVILITTDEHTYAAENLIMQHKDRMFDVLKKNNMVIWLR